MFLTIKETRSYSYTMPRVSLAHSGIYNFLNSFFCNIAFFPGHLKDF